MKYRTIIELICDAVDKEDALHTAGEYLRGEVESGVDMSCKAISLRTHRVLKYGIMSVVVMFFFSSLYLGLAAKEKNDNLRHISDLVLSNTCTIQPVLKTTAKAGFRREWQKKKDEAIFEYIKK
jgi:hypothetical protein